jgi:hypothetical protein
MTQLNVGGVVREVLYVNYSQLNVGGVVREVLLPTTLIFKPYRTPVWPILGDPLTEEPLYLIRAAIKWVPGHAQVVLFVMT